MSLMSGGGPLGRESPAFWNFERVGPAHAMLWEPYPRRLRVVVGGQVMADSTRVRLLHETGILPVPYFPESDVATTLLRASTHSTHCPFKGDASYFDIQAGDRFVEKAVWTYPAPLDGAPPLTGYVAFYAGQMDRWLEEDEEVLGHLKDPYHRVDILRSSRTVRATFDGHLLAESSRPLALFETSLPPRFYLPRADVRVHLSSTVTRTVCPYKGVASYWSAHVPKERVEDMAWSYETPLDGARGLAGYVCFDPQRCDVTVDGEPA